MSDLSALSYEYRNTSEMSKLLNQAIITLKKSQLGLLQQPDSDPVKIQELTVFLTDILDALVMFIGNGHGTSTRDIPPAVVTRLRNQWQGDLEYKLEDLRNLRVALASGKSRLTDQEMELLDCISTATDSESAEVFRKLLRR